MIISGRSRKTMRWIAIVSACLLLVSCARQRNATQRKWDHFLLSHTVGCDASQLIRPWTLAGIRFAICPISHRVKDTRATFSLKDKFMSVRSSRQGGQLFLRRPFFFTMTVRWTRLAEFDKQWDQYIKQRTFRRQSVWPIRASVSRLLRPLVR